jgi:hypothetical protein
LHRFVSTFAAVIALAAAAPAGAADLPAGQHVVYGIVTRIGASSLVIKRHDGRLESVDIAPARSADTTGVLYVNRPVALYGDFDRAGRYHAEVIRSWYGLLRGVWPADR